MNLLRKSKHRAIPSPWLLARLCGRRAAAKERALPWQDLSREYAWIFAKLDRRTAVAISPYFALFELKRLLTALRLLRGQDRSRVAALLTDSLLHESIQRLLLAQGEFLPRFRQILLTLELEPATLTRIDMLLERQSWTYLEEVIFDAGLHHELKKCCNKVVQHFFRDLIDIRNLLALQKALRWRQKSLPDVLRGGNIPAKRLNQAFERGDVAALAGLSLAEKELNMAGLLEEKLLFRLEHRLKQEARQQGGIALLLHYLWNIYLSTRTREVPGFARPLKEAV